MNKLAELAIARADAFCKITGDNRDPEYPLLKWMFEQADSAYFAELNNTPDDKIRAEVDAAIKALMEKG